SATWAGSLASQAMQAAVDGRTTGESPALTRRAPSSRKRRAAARPMPEGPPTIRQRLLARRGMMAMKPAHHAQPAGRVPGAWLPLLHPLTRIQRRDAPRVLRVEILQLLLHRSAADELMAWQEHRLDAAVHQPLRPLAAQHVHDQGAAECAERPRPVSASL